MLESTLQVQVQPQAHVTHANLALALHDEASRPEVALQAGRAHARALVPTPRDYEVEAGATAAHHRPISDISICLPACDQ